MIKAEVFIEMMMYCLAFIEIIIYLIIKKNATEYLKGRNLSNSYLDIMYPIYTGKIGMKDTDLELVRGFKEKHSKIVVSEMIVRLSFIMCGILFFIKYF